MSSPSAQPEANPPLAASDALFHPDLARASRRVGGALFALGMVGLLVPVVAWVYGRVGPSAFPASVWWAALAWPSAWLLCPLVALLAARTHAPTRDRALAYAAHTARRFPAWTLLCLFAGLGSGG